MVVAYITTNRRESGAAARVTKREANALIRAFMVTACSLTTSDSYTEPMQCDEARTRHLVCYLPSNPARSDHAHSIKDIMDESAQAGRAGNGDLLHTSQQVDRPGPVPASNPLESFILAKDYPCRLSPIEQGKGIAACSLYAPIGESMRTGTQ